MDPGPYGCLGAGPGQAIGAKTAHPDRQVVCLLGDGAFGFSGLEFDTMARHDLPVVGIIGNNGIWALEYHPMKFLYGYQVAAELRPATRYDEVVQALGGHGELVRHPSELQPGAGAGVRERQAGAGQCADGSRGRLSAEGGAGVSSTSGLITRRSWVQIPPPLLTNPHAQASSRGGGRLDIWPGQTAVKRTLAASDAQRGVAFRSRARFLRWFYWISILTIPCSGRGLLLLVLRGLQHSDFATTVRAVTGKKPKALAQELCADIERALSMEPSPRD